MSDKKKCYRCLRLKSLDQFSRDKHNSDGRTYDCKHCRRKVYKEWCRNNPEKVRDSIARTKDYRKAYYARPDIKLRHQLSRIERKFGISPSKYLAMVKRQKGLCAICHQPETCSRNVCLSVDHCHSTNRVRALLCSRCNRAIGLFADSIALLRLAIIYLENH